MSKKNTSNSKAILFKGFGFITLLVAALASFWFYMIMENQRQIERILKEQTETRAIFTMRDAAYQRAIILHRMALLKDEFDRDDEYLKLKEKAEEFIKAREDFLHKEDLQPSSNQIQVWENALPDIRKGSRVQAEAANLLINNETERANKVLLNEVIPTQNRVMSQLTELLDIQRKSTEAEVGEISKQNRSGLILISLLGGWAILWGIGIAAYTMRRTARIEQSLDEARLRAQEADKQKSRFLANMSHEIRTPLTAIIGYSETLVENKGDIPDWEKYVDSIIRNGKHLHQLINDILDLSKIEANQLSIEIIPVSVCDIMTEIESLMGERARKKGLTFKLDCQFPIPQTIHSDPTRLKQILINLCGNAIKFTAEGTITLGISYDKAEHKICFTVEDTGIGMNQKQITELFRPFKQADSSTTRKFGGSGLGLYISKQLTECLGGNLSLVSLPSIGSRFTVTIDAGEEISEEWINSAEEANSLTNKTASTTIIPSLYGKVLLAEDNPDNQALISMHLKKVGADIKVVDNGRQAVDTALAEHFDLILMDMQMPVMGGIEAIKLLREKHCQTPIAILTANAMKEDVEQSEQAGANGFLTKPIDRKMFYDILEKYLSPAYEPTTPSADEQTTNDLDDIGDLVDSYVKQLPEICYRIERYVKAKEWEGVKDEIHQLKGTGGAFGFPEITDRCIDIESHLIEKDYDAAEKLIIALENFCATTADTNNQDAPHPHDRQMLST